MDAERLLWLEDRLLLLEELSRRAYGKYRGVVVDNQGDPASAGRIKVRVPEVHGDDAVWAFPCVPYAGPQVGWLVLPPKDAGVWVEFEGGDPSKALWVGCFWADGQLPSEADPPQKRLLRTEKTLLLLDDDEGEIVIKNDRDAKVTWSDQVHTECGGATHTVSSSGVVSESAPGKVEVGASGVVVNDGAFEVS
jgi:uncharacterized protein involved in type VI secretion and phage assembly